MFFGDVALVFGLQIDAPLHRILEFLFRVFQYLDRVGVIHAYEFRVDDTFQFRDQALFDTLFKKRHVIGAFGEDGFDDVLQHRFRQRGVVGQIRKRQFRFDHPEFGEMPGGVGILRAKRRAESVNLG